MANTSGRSLLPKPSKRPIDLITKPFQEFSQIEAAGGLALLAATFLALVWANSPWAGSYIDLFRKTYLTLGFGAFKLSKPLILWINDGLMALFFLLVGLEIKREILDGELSSFRKAVLPIVAALGGMIIPALLFVAFNAGRPTVAGWGIPMATDIAFALGILALAGRNTPIALKVFLVAFAIVDDLGAILVIAVFYTDSLNLAALGLGVGLLLFAVLLSRMGVRSLKVYLLLGIPIWVAFLTSGIHATIAGVLLALVIPNRPLLGRDQVHRAIDSITHHLKNGSTREAREQEYAALTALSDLDEQARPPLTRLEHALHPMVTWFIMPLFALANAGVAIGSKGMVGGLTTPLGLGILLGLFIGKQVGVFGFSWLAVRLRLADFPDGVSIRQIYGAGLLGGVGFTMSLFIAGLAFGDGPNLEVAKLAILTASAISAVVGWALLRTSSKKDVVAEQE